MKSPLVTNDYFFPVTQVVAEPRFPIDDADVNEVDYDIRTGLAQNQDKENEYRVTLEIESKQKEDTPIAYKIQIVVIGTFTVVDNCSKPEKLVEINGASILYSATREFLITVTSRGPYGALMLPTVSFNRTTSKEETDET